MCGMVEGMACAVENGYDATSICTSGSDQKLSLSYPPSTLIERVRHGNYNTDKIISILIVLLFLIETITFSFYLHPVRR